MYIAVITVQLSFQEQTNVYSYYLQVKTRAISFKHQLKATVLIKHFSFQQLHLVSFTNQNEKNENVNFFKLPKQGILHGLHLYLYCGIRETYPFISLKTNYLNFTLHFPKVYLGHFSRCFRHPKSFIPDYLEKCYTKHYSQYQEYQNFKHLLPMEQVKVNFILVSQTNQSFNHFQKQQAFSFTKDVINQLKVTMQQYYLPDYFLDYFIDLFLSQVVRLTNGVATLSSIPHFACFRSYVDVSSVPLFKTNKAKTFNKTLK